MNQEDALLLIVQWLREGSPSRYSNYGYDVYIPNVIRWHLIRTNPRLNDNEYERETRLDDLYPVFVDAAWELCRRGVIRPGVSVHRAQTTDDGSGGSGYSVTAFGRQWLQEGTEDTFVPTEPARFAQMIAPFKERFGSGFHERAQEAIRCYGAHAYLACCAMCGAAAESVLLTTAIAKDGDEARVLAAYSTVSGRRRLENVLIGQADDRIKRDFQGLTGLIKYWRDEAAHGKASQISDNEAYTSLAMLLRVAMFVNSNWGELVG